MTFDEVNQRLLWRLDHVKHNPGPYSGPDDRGLLAGDEIIIAGDLRGWTKREIAATPHLHFDWENRSSYLRKYWLCEWSGVENKALLQRETEMERKKKADEAERRQYDERYGPPPAYRGKKFDNFIVTTPSQVLALDAAQDFPFHGPVDDATLTFNMVFAGPVGTGKTHLLSALYSYRQTEDQCCEFITATNLMRKFREKHAKESVLLARYGDGDVGDDDLDQGCETLLIDDIGIEADRYSSEIFNEILDRRMSGDLSTLLTTNCTATELMEWLGDRGYSRLMYRCKWIMLDGPDWRLSNH